MSKVLKERLTNKVSHKECLIEEEFSPIFSVQVKMAEGHQDVGEERG